MNSQAHRTEKVHTFTRGWIANELFRRADPIGRTIGEFIRDEISAPLKADAIIGVKEQEISRVSKVSVLGIFYQFLESLKPKFLGRAIVHNIFQIQIRLINLVPSILRA